jgi:cyclic 2,3-diphosphoglycerate synthase
MAEDGTDYEAVAAAVRDLKNITVVATVLRPRPVESIEGKHVAFFTTAEPSAAQRLERHLLDEHGAARVTVSCNLSNREELRKDLESVDAEVYLVEIKAAAIDVVCEAASEGDVEVVFADNEVISLPDQPDLDGALRELAEAALAPTAEAVA